MLSSLTDHFYVEVQNTDKEFREMVQQKSTQVQPKHRFEL